MLQELELPSSGDVTVNDAFKPLSRYFDRVWRPEQLPAALLGAMRVLTDPVETGAATVSIPQDVQAEAHDWPESLFAERTWHIARPLPEKSVIARAAEVIRTARKPLIVAGGGVVYSGATEALAAFCEKTGIPVGMSQAGKGALPYDHPQCVGAIGSTGTTAANALATEADVVIGIGTRYSDFTSASRTAFNNPDVRFVNVNVASLDSVKQGGISVVADAREAIEALDAALGDYRVPDDYEPQRGTRQGVGRHRLGCVLRSKTARRSTRTRSSAWRTPSATHATSWSAPPARCPVTCTSFGGPGIRKGYHVEYGYSCMGYEVAGGLGVRMADDDRDVFVMVGDGSYLMMATELVTAVQEGIKVIVVLVQNHGFASIGSLSEALGSQRFGTAYRYRTDDGRLDGAKLPVDLAANAASLGADVVKAATAAEFADAVKVAKASRAHHRDPRRDRSADRRTGQRILVGRAGSPRYPTLESTQTAYQTYADWKKIQRPLIRPSDS